MVAGNQPPQFPAHHQRDHKGRAHAHVLEILGVDGRHAAQEAQGHVEILAREGRQARDQGLGLVMNVRQQAHPVLLIEPPGDLRNVGGGIAIAQKGFEIRFLRFGEDLAMAGLIEAIDHDAVIAGQVFKDAGGLVAQALQRAGAEKMLDRLLYLG